jgi:hypothetical protein
VTHCSRTLFFLGTFLFLYGMARTGFAQTVAPPPGWTTSQDGTNWIYTPVNLPAGKTFTLTVQPVEPRGGQDLTSWFTAHAQADLRRRGV